MKFINLFRFLSGYVVLEITGGFKERFINLCSQNNICLFEISYENETLTACVKKRSFKKLRRIRKATGVKIKIKDKIGFPFYLNKHKDRVGLFAGIIACLILMVVLNNFVWTIEAVGSEKYTEQQIISVLKDYGLDFGTYIPDFDEEAVCREIVNDFEGEILWLAINIKGSKAVIEVRDFVKAEEIKPGSPCNIVADKDGVILFTEIISGTGVVKSGSAVTKGDLLISGVAEKADTSTAYLEAKGTISALTTNEHNFSFNTQQMRDKFNKVSSYYTIQFLGFKIPLGFYKPEGSYNKFEKAEYLKWNGVRLPFGTIKTYIAEYKRDILSKERNEIIAISKFCDEAYEKFKNTKILYSQINKTFEENTIKINGKYSCIDFIGKKVDIIIKND